MLPACEVCYGRKEGGIRSHGKCCGAGMLVRKRGLVGCLESFDMVVKAAIAICRPHPRIQPRNFPYLGAQRLFIRTSMGARIHITEKDAAGAIRRRHEVSNDSGHAFDRVSHDIERHEPFKVTRKQHQFRTSWFASLKATLFEIFLPAGFPASVSPGQSELHLLFELLIRLGG